MIDSDVRSYFAAEVFEYQGICGQIQGPRLGVMLVPDDGSPKQVKEIRVTLHVDHGSVREVDVKIHALDLVPSEEEWLDPTISDRDVYTWSKADGRSIRGRAISSAIPPLVCTPRTLRLSQQLYRPMRQG